MSLIPPPPGWYVRSHRVEVAQKYGVARMTVRQAVESLVAEGRLRPTEQVETLVQIRTQDLEPDPHRGGARIREGVAADRRVSIADKDMRHGRKSKSKRFNGFKRHIAADADRGLILACAITPAAATHTF